MQQPWETRVFWLVENTLFEVGCSLALIAYVTLLSASRSIEFFCAVPLGFLNLLLLEPESIYGYNLPLTALTGFAIGWVIHRLWRRVSCAGLLILGMVFVLNVLAFFAWFVTNIEYS